MKQLRAKYNEVRCTPKVLLDSQHIKAITKALNETKMSRTELSIRLGIKLDQLSKMLCFNMNVNGWLMPRITFTRLNAILKIDNT